MNATALILTRKNERWLTDCLPGLGETAVVYHAAGIGVYGRLKLLPTVKQDTTHPSSRRAEALADLLQRYPQAERFVVLDDPGVPQLCGRADALQIVEDHESAAREQTEKSAIRPCSNSTAAQSAIEPPRIVHTSTEIPRGTRTRYACDVVIPYYRGLQWLPQTIEAVLAQSCVDVVVHLVNDDSPEDDSDVRSQFAGCRQLRWYRNRENVGPYVSYHGTWKHHETDWFAVQDADDIPLPNRLWRSIAALDRYRADIYGGCMEQFAETRSAGERNLRHASQTPILKPVCRHRVTLLNGAMVCRRSCVADLNGWYDAYPCGADNEFVLRADYAGCRFVLDDQVVCLRRLHDSSLSRGGKYRMDGDGRAAVIAEYNRRRQAFAAETDATGSFDPRPWGVLDQTDPALTRRIA